MVDQDDPSSAIHRPASDATLHLLVSHALGFQNPYITRLCDEVAAHGVRVERFRIRSLLRERVDVWHIHWADSIANRATTPRSLADLFRLVAHLIIAKLRRIGIIWTVHNARTHDSPRPRIDRAVRWIMVRAIDGWIALSDEAAQEATRAMPRLRKRRHWTIPHGDYRSDYEPSPPREEARRALDIPADATVLVYFGLIRPYKNVPGLIRSFRQIADHSWQLIVAGKPLGEDEAAIRNLAADDPRIRLHLRHIEDAEVPRLIGAGDLTVLPFKRILNSGSAMLSLSLDRPVLVPALGSMVSLEQLIGSPWVLTYDGELTPDRLARAVEEAAHADGEAPLAAFDWGRIAAVTAGAYREVAKRVERVTP